MRKLNSGLLVALSLIIQAASATDYTLATNNGRVIDPESGLDAVCHIGISGSVAGDSWRKPGR